MIGNQHLYTNRKASPYDRRSSFSCAFFADDESVTDCDYSTDGYLNDDPSYFDSSISFVNDNDSFCVDYSEVSALVGDDDDLDMLEKELERFAANKEKEARKEKRSSAKMAAAFNAYRHNQPACTERRGSHKSLRSAATVSSAPQLTRTNSSNCFPIIRNSSNKSLPSLCKAKEQMEQQVVLLAENELDNFDWDRYFASDVPEYSKETATELAKIMRSQNLDKLRELWKSGVRMDYCNSQGETLVHIACQKASTKILRFLMKEAKVSVRVRSNLTGKNPLHELCWSPEFNREIAMMLLSDSPELLWAVDKRNFTGLDYVPRRSRQDWTGFLTHKGPVLKMALELSRFKSSCKEHQSNQMRLLAILEQRIASNSKKNHQLCSNPRSTIATTSRNAATTSSRGSRAGALLPRNS